MYRAALRSSPSALRTIRPTVASGARRLASTAPAKKKGTWKGTGLRWGLAIGAVYFYNTSPIFADELPRTFPPHPSVLLAGPDTALPQLKQVRPHPTSPTRIFPPSMS